MSVASPAGCEIKRLLSKCGASVVGVCQYCGRPFCAEHGEVMEDGQQVCTRKSCVEKRNDVERHLVYKEAVSKLNAELLCGVPGCRDELAGQCIRCKGFFCQHHVHGRDEMYLHNGVRTTRRSSLCQHCWARRPIWVKL